MLFLLFLLFLGLELGHVIDWPWYAVAAPLAPAILIWALVLIGVSVGGLKALTSGR